MTEAKLVSFPSVSTTIGAVRDPNHLASLAAAKKPRQPKQQHQQQQSKKASSAPGSSGEEDDFLPDKSSSSSSSSENEDATAPSHPKPVSMKQLAAQYSLDPELYGLRRSSRAPKLKNDDDEDEPVHRPKKGPASQKKGKGASKKGGPEQGKKTGKPFFSFFA